MSVSDVRGHVSFLFTPRKTHRPTVASCIYLGGLSSSSSSPGALGIDICGTGTSNDKTERALPRSGSVGKVPSWVLIDTVVFAPAISEPSIRSSESIGKSHLKYTMKQISARLLLQPDLRCYMDPMTFAPRHWCCSQELSRDCGRKHGLWPCC